MNIYVTHIDTACVLLDINGYKILTDPTLDAAGKLYYHGSGTFSRKTSDPAIDKTTLSNIDLILLSHHQHKDNFDIKGKAFALTVPTILSTVPASKAIPGITGLDDWECYSITTTKVPGLKITATPAQHHPWWVPEFLAGKVIGFVIEFDGQENGVIYISGDTVFFSGIQQIARRFKIDTAILHAGSVQFRYLTGFGKYTMDSKDLIRTVELLNPRTVIPVHHHGWSHFKEKEIALRNAILSNSKVYGKTLFLSSGSPFQLP
jgi:L-ascorbate metabolism protein UlaG (beta-lactamase superfamily)